MITNTPDCPILNGLNYADYYNENGYVVIENLIPEDKIERLLDCLEQFKKSGYPYYSQSIHKWISPEIDSYGFMVESMENFTALALNKGLSRAGNEILLGSQILEALRLIKSDFVHFCQWQNMLFDRSTGTVDHIDSWYLDTFPKGNLIGAWIALEDINKESGPFRVYPGSHKLINPTDMQKYSLNEHTAFVTHCAELVQSLIPMDALLKKGSVLFWHPFTIHGSANQISPECSRKSLTAHYYPLGLARQKNTKGMRREAKYGPLGMLRFEIKNIRSINNLPIYVYRTPLQYMRFNVEGLARFAINKFNPSDQVFLEMRRSRYEHIE